MTPLYTRFDHMPTPELNPLEAMSLFFKPETKVGIHFTGSNSLL